MDITFYKEIDFDLEFVFEQLKSKLDYNLRFKNNKGFNEIFNEILREICNLLLKYQSNIKDLEQFERLKLVLISINNYYNKKKLILNKIK